MEVDNALKIIYTMQEATINTSSVSMASRDNFDGMEKRPWLSVDDVLDELDADDLEPVMQGSDDEEFVLEGAEEFEESDPDSDVETQDVLSGEDPTLTPRDLPSPPSHTSSTTTPSPPPSDTSSTPSPPPESLIWTTELEPVDIEPFTEAVTLLAYTLPFLHLVSVVFGTAIPTFLYILGKLLLLIILHAFLC